MISGLGTNSDSLRQLLQPREGRSDAPALLAPNQRILRLGQLVEQVDYVGHVLRSGGISRGDRVAVVLPNGPALAAAFIGVAAFATCAPLNPQYRQEELEFYFSDLEAKAVIVLAGERSPAAEVADRMGLRALALKNSPGGPAGQFRLNDVRIGQTAPEDWGRDQDTALILHTSGTTSRPKVVPLSHRNLCCSARSVARVLQLTGQDRCLNIMPLFHIHGLVGILLSSLSAGASVVCTPGFQPEAFGSWMRELKPTWYSAVPTLHQAVLGVVRASPSARGNSLRLIRSSSSALAPVLMEDLESVFGVPVIEAYGMTEAAHQMASNSLPPAERKPGSVGLPAGPEMAIMDDQGQLLGPDTPGEIVIRGPNVVAGYQNNPQANAAAFRDGWFRTGDVGRKDRDGYFYITGRAKEMINRGGEKIAPREIDEVLLQHPAVAQAVAFAVPHARLGEDVAAAVVIRSGAQTSEQELRAFGRERLTEFKVPSQILFVPEIPKGPSGKLQRVGLQAKLSKLLRPAFVAPQTTAETTLANLWQNILGQGTIGVGDNFFRLGGDSLLATQLTLRINSCFDLDLSIEAVFRAPTLAAQAVLIEAALIDRIENEVR